ncbi:hypothetical protein V8G54_004056 [Vigna mungo]|uniref:FAD/NAD(P)-binding domain-containing protein n=1 Tax=Vigna mungo TaxID=3915 RepID=A0AAQ3PD52_VIGMU
MVTLKIRGAERNSRARTEGPKGAANLIIRPSLIGFVRPRFEPRICFHQTDPDPKHFKSDRLRHGTGDSDFRPKKKTLRCRKKQTPSFSGISSNPLRVCVVGSGPTGFYTAEKMLKAHQQAQVDIVDRLPTPFGLVRSGVAPDHPETKGDPFWLQGSGEVKEVLSYAVLWLFRCFGVVVVKKENSAESLIKPNLCNHVFTHSHIELSLPENLQQIVINQFSRVAQQERCSFFGNVTLGSSISLSELRELYHVVVLAYGAESDRSVGIPGENLKGIHSAREFVWWYNGHPDGQNLEPDLKSTDTAVILGQGNVALDVARILLRPTTELATTDIASHALATLEESCIRVVYLVGRRGPAQAACTAKELREILGIHNVDIFIQESDLLLTPVDEEELKSNRIQRRVHELLSKAARSKPKHVGLNQRELRFVFFRKPNDFQESKERAGHVSGVHFEKTLSIAGVSHGKQIAIGTGEFEDIKCGMVLKSIGYKSVPVDGLPFDHKKGIVPNDRGRVLSDSSDPTVPEKGLYVCGWLKRGPTGIIATNLYCAEETVSSISEDLEKGGLIPSSALEKPGRVGLLQLLHDRNVRIVSFSDWEKIDSEERRLGSLRNKPREKLATWDELYKAIS